MFVTFRINQAWVVLRPNIVVILALYAGIKE
jgi:hypothetical protein